MAALDATLLRLGKNGAATLVDLKRVRSHDVVLCMDAHDLYAWVSVDLPVTKCFDAPVALCNVAGARLLPDATVVFGSARCRADEVVPPVRQPCEGVGHLVLRRCDVHVLYDNVRVQPLTYSKKVTLKLRGSIERWRASPRT